METTIILPREGHRKHPEKDETAWQVNYGFASERNSDGTPLQSTCPTPLSGNFDCWSGTTNGAKRSMRTPSFASVAEPDVVGATSIQAPNFFKSSPSKRLPHGHYLEMGQISTIKATY